jgi:hypothetical protein
MRYNESIGKWIQVSFIGDHTRVIPVVCEKSKISKNTLRQFFPEAGQEQRKP